ncbi:MAG TPA: hypothetical protein VGJ73_07940 [Verrucomicrobiae bacterium]
MKKLISFIVATFLISLTSLRAVPGDEHWDAQFGWPGPGGEILSIATQNGQIYASGLFTPSTNAPVEAWNGAQWNAIGQVYGYPQAIVYDMAVVGNYLYIAGSFTNVSGVAANGLARWDGANWSSVGFSGSLAGLAVSGNNLYVAGAFTNSTADGGVATNIASWDGSAWHMLGGGVGLPGNGSAVETVAIQNGLVYAGGAFTNSGSLLVTNLAVWNGSSWSGLGGPFSSAVYALAFNGGNIFAGGVFSQVGATTASGIAQWNGSAWSQVGGGLAGGSPFSDVTRLAVFNGAVYASGSFTSAGGVAATNIAAWNGSTWSALGAGVSSTITRVYSNVTNLYVGGNFLLAGGVIANGLASWNGAAWSAIGPGGRLNGLSSSVFAMAGNGTNLFAGGLFSAAGQTAANYVGRFDGTSWYPLGSGIGPAGGLTIVRSLAMATNGVYVGGQFNTAGSAGAANIAFWNGANWSALGGGPGGVVANMLIRPEGLYIVGASLEGSGPNYFSPIFMRWDGANWYNELSTSNAFFSEPFNTPDITMDAIAAVGSNIYVGGRFNYAQGDQNFIMDATSCPDIFCINHGGFATLVGTGVNSNVLDMAVIGTNLYVSGYFTNAGGIAASHIAMWDGANWHTVGSGVVGSGYVDTLAAIGTNLYAGGTFTNMGGVAASRIARWDGNNWWALGSGGNSTVLGLYSSGNDLYAGGSFRTIGNKASYFIGHWNDQVNFNTPQLINSKWLSGGQFQARLYGVPGVTNIVQASTNLTVWTPILTNSAGIYDFTDPNSPVYPHRFYRGVLSQ